MDELTNSSIIHDKICKLYHKKRHPKSYHDSDIKDHMTLNNIHCVIIINHYHNVNHLCNGKEMTLQLRTKNIYNLINQMIAYTMIAWASSLSEDEGKSCMVRGHTRFPRSD